MFNLAKCSIKWNSSIPGILSYKLILSFTLNGKGSFFLDGEGRFSTSQMCFKFVFKVMSKILCRTWD